MNVIWSEEEDTFIASSDRYPGLTTQGNTEDEAVNEYEKLLLLIDKIESEYQSFPNPQRGKIIDMHLDVYNAKTVPVE